MAKKYRNDLKQLARNLRSNMTDAEQKLWYHLRRKQINGIQFYRQRPIGNYVVDFYAPSAKFIVEVDGGQHFDAEGLANDQKRTAYLTNQGLRVLRYSNHQVFKETDAVVQDIEAAVGLEGIPA